MAPGSDSYCVVNDGADGTTSYFSLDLDEDASIEAGETFIFPPDSRWLVNIYSGSGSAVCCWVDEHNVEGVVEPDAVLDVGLVDPSSAGGVTSEPGACFYLNDSTANNITVMATRGPMAGLSGIYGGVCTSTQSAGGGTASADYPFSQPVRKACDGTGDCQDADFVNGITFFDDGADAVCDSTPSFRQLAETGLLLACNFTADIDLVACEKK